MNDYGFGNRLYELRKKRGLSQAALAGLLGVTDKAVSKWETGAAKPRTNLLRRLSALLNVSIEEMLLHREKEEQVDMIGLSGLITPSLEEMVNVAHEMQRAGLDIPIMIGGATTSELHVALKIAPVYGGPVVWMKDASQNALVAAKLMNKEEEQQMEKELDAKYEHLREAYETEQQQLLSLEEARKKKPNLWED